MRVHCSFPSVVKDLEEELSGVMSIPGTKHRETHLEDENDVAQRVIQREDCRVTEVKVRVKANTSLTTDAYESWWAATLAILCRVSL